MKHNIIQLPDIWLDFMAIARLRRHRDRSRCLGICYLLVVRLNVQRAGLTAIHSRLGVAASEYYLPSDLPAHCVCGQGFSVNHAMNCPTGGHPTLRHNELRDFTAETLSQEVCTDVCVEPSLQPLTGETFDYATANLEDGARVDVCAAVFGVVAIRRLILM